MLINNDEPRVDNDGCYTLPNGDCIGCPHCPHSVHSYRKVVAAVQTLRRFVSAVEADVATRFVVRSAAADHLKRTAWVEDIK